MENRERIDLNNIELDKIKSKIQQLPVLDTSDGTVTPSDIAKDKIAYSKGKKVVGTYEGADITKEEYDYALELTDNILGGKETFSYLPLDYIESTGTQWIDTNYYANGNTRYEFSYSGNKTNGVLFGAYNAGDWEEGSGLYTNITGSVSTRHLWYHYNSNTEIRTYTETPNSLINLDKYMVSINNTAHSISLSQKTFDLEEPTYIFAGNWSGEAVQPTSYKLHYFKIYDNGKLVKYFVPSLRESDNSIGLYELLEGKFYENQGTGEFITGGVIDE